jgi:tetratricopeptide (TPR) repeat protein
MRFRDVRIGEGFTLRSETPVAWRVILKKVSDERAEDDRSVTIAIGEDEECDVLATTSLSHALWFEHDGAWKLVLRWTTPRDARAKWATIDPRAAEDGTTKAIAGGEQEPAEDRRARALLASALHARGDTRQAISLYDELLTEQVDAALLNNRGAARASEGDIQGAIEDYTHAIALDDSLAQAYSNRGNALTKLSKYREALDDYDQALARAGDVAAIYCNRGLARKMLGDMPASIEDFEAAIQLDERFAPAYLARGSVRALQGDVQGAVRDLERFLELSPTAPQAGQVRTALTRLHQALGRV